MTIVALPGLPDVVVQRVLVRNGVSHDLARSLLDDLRRAIAWSTTIRSPNPSPLRTRVDFIISRSDGIARFIKRCAIN
jgi:hypothetical protein